MKYTFHVPVQQYGFLEIEGEKDDLPSMERAYNEYAEKPVKFKGSSNAGFVNVKTFTGETIQYNAVDHEYRDLAGNKLLGGSTYAAQFGKHFDAKMLLPRCSKAWGIDEEVIQDIWDMNRDTSNLLGSAVHLGLELAHKHMKNGTIIANNKKDQVENYALPKSPIVRKAVKAFIAKYGLDALPEVFVSDVANKKAGQIDRLVITGDKTCRVQDYKTSAQDKDTELTYQHQASYYASCLTKAGWTVEGIDIFYYGEYNGVMDWKKKSLKVLEVK